MAVQTWCWRCESRRHDDPGGRSAPTGTASASGRRYPPTSFATRDDDSFHRLLALDLDQAARAEVEPVHRQSVGGRSTDLHRPGQAVRLEPTRGVHRVAPEV